MATYAISLDVIFGLLTTIASVLRKAKNIRWKNILSYMLFRDLIADYETIGVYNIHCNVFVHKLICILYYYFM